MDAPAAEARERVKGNLLDHQLSSGVFVNGQGPAEKLRRDRRRSAKTLRVAEIERLIEPE
jgi:hypothetical protein